MLTPAENLPITAEESHLSIGEVLSLSVQNLIAFVSSQRPWLELLALGSMDRPTSFSSALSRSKLNLHHFVVNYSLVIVASVILFLVSDPTALVTVASFAILWLLLCFCRDHPLVLYGLQISDKAIFFGLIVGSFWGLWLTHCFLSLVLGVVTGVLLCLAHAILRNPDDLFVQEEQVVVPSNFLHWS
ncbi:PRA1 family protein G1 [Hirschfeldia incana]|nr:PRA1 family protein G1 [Hirschfeldia incana]